MTGSKSEACEYLNLVELGGCIQKKVSRKVKKIVEDKKKEIKKRYTRKEN